MGVLHCAISQRITEGLDEFSDTFSVEIQRLVDTTSHEKVNFLI